MTGPQLLVGGQESKSDNPTEFCVVLSVVYRTWWPQIGREERQDGPRNLKGTKSRTAANFA